MSCTARESILSKDRIKDVIPAGSQLRALVASIANPPSAAINT
jgi:hypothetical protein